MRVFIDISLILDIKSLAFCIIRFKIEQILGHQIDSNHQYLMNKPTIQESVEVIFEKSEIEYSDDHLSEIMQTFEKYLTSLKPKIQVISILDQLKEQSEVVLYSQLESNIIEKIRLIYPEFLLVDIREEIIKPYDVIFYENESLNEKTFKASKV